MATNLYEVLGVNKNASPEEIRKAYRKRALQTHPDRIPPTATPDEKKAAEEQFRKVNNAYEVLTDDSNRKLYDRYGVWPPPEPSAEPQPNPRSNYHRATVDPFGSNPFSSDPFFSSGFGFGPHRPFTFTDPFVLFNSLFGDLHGAFEENPFFSDPFLSPFDSRSPFGMDPFERAMVSPFGSRSPFGSLFGPSPTMHGLPGSSSSTRSYSAVSRSIGMNGQWVSQSKMTRTVNGRTETIHKRRDAQGNEHITYSSPEGERYTINGVEQPQPGHSISAPPPPPTTFQTRPQSPPMINAPPPPLQPLFVPPPPQVTNYHTPPPQPQPQPQPQAHGGYNYNTPQSNQYSGASSNYPAQPTAHYSLPSASQTQPAPVPSRFTYPDPRRSHDRASYSGSSTQSGHGSRAHDSARRDTHRSQREPATEARWDNRDGHREAARDGRHESARDRARHILRRGYKERERAPSDIAVHPPAAESDRSAQRADGQDRKWWQGGWLHSLTRFLVVGIRRHWVHSG